MDFQIDSIADDDSSVTLSWTAPAQSYLNQSNLRRLIDYLIFVKTFLVVISSCLAA